MKYKNLLTLILVATVISALFLTSCSNGVQRTESSDVEQETVTEDTVVEEVDDLLLDENEDIEIGEII